MRTNHSIKNISIGVLSQVVIVIMGFISRKVFIDSLGADYLGINGLLTNVLSMLVLVEGGIAISIVYNLYKPLAENNKAQVISLIQLYKKAYGILAIITLLISVGLYPLLVSLMKDGGDSIPYLVIIYSLFVAKNVISYLNAHKWSLINADQKGYVLEKWNLIFRVSTILARIFILILTKDYILYLAVELMIYAIQNIMNGKIVNKRYSYIKTKEKYPLDKNTKDNIVKNVKAMFLSNIGSYIVFSTDNILISSFVGVVAVGLYSNYTMIVQQLSALVKPVLSGIGASVGNLIATEKSDKNFAIFKISYLVNFWIFSLCVIFLFNLLQPFISWWLGEKFLLSHLTFVLILINFYLTGMSSSIITFKNKSGLFSQDKYAALIQGGINLIASIILVKSLGLAGIFLGTTISTIATVFWTQPIIVYKNVFKKSFLSYYTKYGYYVFLTVTAGYVTTNVCNVFANGVTFLSLVERGLICLVIPNIIYILIFYKTQEFTYLKNVAGGVLSGLKVKLISAGKVKTKNI